MTDIRNCIREGCDFIRESTWRWSEPIIWKHSYAFEKPLAASSMQTSVAIYIIFLIS